MKQLGVSPFPSPSILEKIAKAIDPDEPTESFALQCESMLQVNYPHADPVNGYLKASQPLFGD